MSQLLLGLGLRGHLFVAGPAISTSCCSSTWMRGASGSNYGREHPEVVSAVMISASLDWAARTIAAARATAEEFLPPNGSSLGAGARSGAVVSGARPTTDWKAMWG